jgi:hypothetical protein
VGHRGIAADRGEIIEIYAAQNLLIRVKGELWKP